MGEVNPDAEVAVILTSYNRPILVRKAIASVVRQTYGNWVLYIMDDNSIENVKAILRRCRAKDSRIKLWFSKVRNKDRLKKTRYAVLINIALKASHEPLITYLTDDCGMYKNKLNDMVHWMHNHPKADFCYGTQKVVNRKGKNLFARGGFGVVTNPSGVLDHSQIMFRRRALSKVGLWPEGPRNICMKDAEWFTRVVRKGYKFYPIGKLTDWLIYHPRRLTNLALTGKLGEITKGCLME